MTGGLVWPGGSTLHRAPVGLKLAVLVIASTGILIADRLLVSAAALVAALLGAAVCGIPLRFVARQLRAIALLVVILAAVQAAIGRAEQGAHAGLRLLAIAALAVLVTATTPAPAMATWVEDAFTRLRVHPDRKSVV